MPPKLKILCITLGGKRKSLIEEQFNSSADFRENFTLTFSPGVLSRELRNREGLLGHAFNAGILVEDPTCTFFAGSVSSQKGQWPDVDYPSDLWKKGRSLGRERSVLACLLAHLNAMRTAVEGGFDVIIEDNVRVTKDGNALAQNIRRVINDSTSAGVRYFGYLGPQDNLDWFFLHHIRKYPENSPTVPFPFEEHFDSNGGQGSGLWGAYAYMVSRDGYETILSKLQCDIGALLWRGKRMKTYRVKPIDKIIPRRVREGGFEVVCGRLPCFFRAPMLESKIHKKYDAAFCEATEFELELCGLSWRGLWLDGDEKIAVARVASGGKWGGEETEETEAAFADVKDEYHKKKKKAKSLPKAASSAPSLLPLSSSTILSVASASLLIIMVAKMIASHKSRRKF